MEVALGVLADGANVSQEGKLNILGVFDIIYARDFPIVHPSMQLVIRFNASAAERGTRRRATVKLLDADGNELLSLAGDVSVPERAGIEDIGVVSIIGLNNVKFDRSGDYSFRILLDDDEKYRVPFKVVRRQQPSLPA